MRKLWVRSLAVVLLNQQCVKDAGGVDAICNHAWPTSPSLGQKSMAPDLAGGLAQDYRLRNLPIGELYQHSLRACFYYETLNYRSDELGVGDAY